MHDCQKFREELTIRILGPNQPNPEDAFTEELNSCEACRDFHNDARTMLRIVDSAVEHPPELSSEYWDGFNTRLRADRLEDQKKSRLTRRPEVFRMLLAFAASILLIVAIWIPRQNPS